VRLAGESILTPFSVPLLALHLLFVELSFIGSGWAFVELIEPTKVRIMRAKWATFGGFLCNVASMVIGRYFVALYPKGRNVGSLWPSIDSHIIIWERSWDLLLISSLVAGITFLIVWLRGDKMTMDKNSRYAALVLLAILVAGAAWMLSMDAMTAILPPA
jgi:hypothetical protein